MELDADAQEVYVMPKQPKFNYVTLMDRFTARLQMNKVISYHIFDDLPTNN